MLFQLHSIPGTNGLIVLQLKPFVINLLAEVVMHLASLKQQATEFALSPRKTLLCRQPILLSVVMDVVLDVEVAILLQSDNIGKRLVSLKKDAGHTH